MDHSGQHGGRRRNRDGLARPVVEASEDAFRRLRDLRDRGMEGTRATDQVYLEGRGRYDDALAALRTRMRQDLSLDLG